MKTSKMISVFNDFIYILFSLVLSSFYLSKPYLLIYLLGSLFVIFLYKKGILLLIIVIILNGLFIYKYHFELKQLNETNFPNQIICKIVSMPKYKNFKHSFYCKNDLGTILVKVNDEDHSEVYNLGDTIAFKNNLQRVKNNTIPNQFNYAKYLLSKRVIYSSTHNKVNVISTKKTFIERTILKIKTFYQDVEYSEYLTSFLIGDKYAISDEVKGDMQNLNISHLFVVSGFHVGFLYLIIKWNLKYLHITEERSDYIAALFIIMFLILNQFSASVLRAVLLVISYILKKKHKWNIKNINLLSGIAVTNLLWNPFLIYDTGFILSYLITFILFLSHHLFNQYQHHKFINVFKINIVAQAFSLPITANFTFTYNFFSILLVPFLSLYYTFIIFPVTILTLLCHPLSNYFNNVFALYENIINFLSEFQSLNINIGYFDFNRMLIYYLFLFMILFNLEKRKKILLHLLTLCVVILFYHKLTLSEEVTYFDVSQGDSIYIRSDQNQCKVLIDTGGQKNYHPQEMVVNYFKSTQVKTIDILFISHTDFDHAGDYLTLLESIEVKNIVFSSYDESDLKDEITQYAYANKINILDIQAYNKVKCGKLIFHIINPKDKNNTINDNSLVLFFIFNGDHYLFTGDISKEVEEQIGADYNLIVDFLKISHHGSKYSTSEKTLNKFKVKHAIVSVGQYNLYNHPSHEILDLLKDNRIKVYRTDIDGSITVKYYLTKKRMIYNYKPYNINA